MSSKKVQIFKPYLAMVKKIGETIGVPRMRQSEVAKELGVTTAGISDMSKKDYIPADTMLRWAKRRKVSVDWLLSDEAKGENIPTNQVEEGYEMLKDKVLELQEKCIELMEENSSLKETIASLGSKTPVKKKAV
jgi:transcriptional regulator with XRE-family HTH domain